MVGAGFHLGALAVDSVHGLGACIDGMGQLLLHGVVGLSHIPNAETTLTYSESGLQESMAKHGSSPVYEGAGRQTKLCYKGGLFLRHHLRLERLRTL